MQIKTVNVFGCSQSYGVPKYTLPNNLGHGSWVYWLSVWNPDITFNNYSYPGSSLVYSCHAYEKYKHTADINIIQMTGPHRMTYYTPLLDPFILPLGKVTNNYFKITDIDWFVSKFVTVTHLTGNENPKTRRHWHDNWISFLDEYYKIKPRDYAMIEHLALMEYFGKRADFAFSHAHYFRTNHTELHTIVPSILNQMSEETYLSYKCDEPGHFNEAGHKFMAKWVAQNTNLAFSE